MVIGMTLWSFRVIIFIDIATFCVIVAAVIPGMVVTIDEPEGVSQPVPDVFIVKHHWELDFSGEFTVSEAHAGADACGFFVQVIKVVISRVDEADVAAIVGYADSLAWGLGNHGIVHLKLRGVIL